MLGRQWSQRQLRVHQLHHTAQPAGISSYCDKEDFVLLPLSGYDAILGMPWLERLDPVISWSRKSMSFHHGGQQHVLEPSLALHLISGTDLLRAVMCFRPSCLPACRRSVRWIIASS